MKYIGILLICIVWSGICEAQQKSVIFDNAEFQVEPLSSVNTVASEISPAFVHNSIFFSGIPTKYLNKSKKKINSAFYSIFSANTDSNGFVSTTRRLVLGFGADFHEGPATYCEKTGELFVTMSDIFESDSTNNISGKQIRLRIVIMKFFDSRWQIIEELPFNDYRFHFAHPAISSTGDTLVFSSDFNSTNYGNTDLFMTVRNNNVWSAPVNLGNNINTPGNEMFPTFIDGGILSFASDGRIDKMGGLDIYYTNFPDSAEVKILNWPINTTFDDFGLIIHKNEDVGYFSSNRNEGNSDDIFKLKINKLFEIINGKVIDQVTSTPIPNAKLVFYNCDGVYINETLTDSLGSFSIQLPDNDCVKVDISKKGYKNNSRNIHNTNYTEFKLEQKRYYEIVALEADSLFPVEGVSVFCEDTSFTNNNGFIRYELPLPEVCEMNINKQGYLNLNWKVDTAFKNVVTRDTVFMYKKEQNKSYLLKSNYSKWSILRDVETELNRLISIMKLNPDINVEIGFHTDSRGGDSYNEWLSQKNAEIAENYIIENGIEQKRIAAKGYGEKYLINHCANGVDCTEEEHGQNRRIEFKITGINAQ